MVKQKKSQREVEDEARLYGDVTVKEWIRGKKYGKTH